MKAPSFSLIVSGIFIAYIAHSAWSIYSLFTPKQCKTGEQCIRSSLRKSSTLDLILQTSTNEVVRSEAELSKILHTSSFDPFLLQEFEVNVSIPAKTRNNGSLYIHVFVVPSGKPMFSENSVYTKTKITTFVLPAPKTINLVNDKDTEFDSSETNLPVTHWRSRLTVSIMTDDISFDRRSVPAELHKFIKVNRNWEYLPMLYVDELSYRIKDLVPVNSSCKSLTLSVSYEPISVGKLRLWTNFEESMKFMHNLGFTEKDVDEVKGIFSDTNFYFLMLTFIVAAFHMLFDFLAFKNDISYWKERKDMVGLSSKVIVWRCISTCIIFLYLMDENTSLLVLIPAGIGTIIEIWKVTKAFKIKVSWQNFMPKLEFGVSSEREKETQNFDSQAMKYLSYVLWPLCFGGAVYSLMYVPHKSWYSWCINSLVNGIYAFGFLFMLPQLFLNYKLKSVAHLPWRAFMYKAFNTFIDDVFAFIITMPTAHRLACFRDDFVFLIYLYQRWLYPVDKSRVNEYGQSFSDKGDKKNK